MIELMKNMEDPEQAEPVCDPEQAKQVCDPEQTEQVCDPEQTIALEETERLMSEYDPEQTAELIVEEEPGRSEDLTGSGIFLFDGMEFRTPSELARYFQSYADESRRALSRKVRQLYADKEHLLPEFEAWLIAIGKEKELNAWKRKIQGMR